MPAAGRSLTLCPLDAARDLDAVTALCASAADYLELEVGPENPVAAARRFFNDRPPGDGVTPLKLGLRRGEGPLVGIADLAIGYPDRRDAFIGLLLLAPDQRGQGLGALAVERLAAMARQRDCTRLLIGVLEANPRGRAFWQRRGFVLEAVRPGLPFGERVHTVFRMSRPLAD